VSSDTLEFFSFGVEQREGLAEGGFSRGRVQTEGGCEQGKVVDAADRMPPSQDELAVHCIAGGGAAALSFRR
jgi:hypothetical protein